MAVLLGAVHSMVLEQDAGGAARTAGLELNKGKGVQITTDRSAILRPEDSIAISKNGASVRVEVKELSPADLCSVVERGVFADGVLNRMCDCLEKSAAEIRVESKENVVNSAAEARASADVIIEGGLELPESLGPKTSDKSDERPHTLTRVCEDILSAIKTRYRNVEGKVLFSRVQNAKGPEIPDFSGESLSNVVAALARYRDEDIEEDFTAGDVSEEELHTAIYRLNDVVKNNADLPNNLKEYIISQANAYYSWTIYPILEKTDDKSGDEKEPEKTDKDTRDQEDKDKESKDKDGTTPGPNTSGGSSEIGRAHV